VAFGSRERPGRLHFFRWALALIADEGISSHIPHPQRVLILFPASSPPRIVARRSSDHPSAVSSAAGAPTVPKPYLRPVGSQRPYQSQVQPCRWPGCPQLSTP